MFRLKQIQEPSSQVVTVVELKEYLRIDNDLEDGRLEVMESAAVKTLEDEIGLKFITQDWDVFMDHWPMQSSNKWWDGTREMAISEVVSPSKFIDLPIGQCQELLEFSTYSDAAEFSENVSSYNVDLVGNRCRIGLKLGSVWPTTVLRSVNGIRFRVRVGFGNASSVPNSIKQAVKELVAHMYENRGDQNEMSIPPHVLTLVNGFRRMKIGC